MNWWKPLKSADGTPEQETAPRRFPSRKLNKSNRGVWAGDRLRNEMGSYWQRWQQGARMPLLRQFRCRSSSSCWTGRLRILLMGHTSNSRHMTTAPSIAPFTTASMPWRIRPRHGSEHRALPRLCSVAIRLSAGRGKARRIAGSRAKLCRERCSMGATAFFRAVGSIDLQPIPRDEGKQRLSMTVVVAFNCTDGVVIAADCDHAERLRPWHHCLFSG